MERIATQFVLYASDAVDVSYSDNSRLQVAPCGTSFVFSQPPTDGVHPLHGDHKVLQRTRYATSAFKPLILEALDFRNRFAARPYICAEIMPVENILRLHGDIRELLWPPSLKEANIEVLPNGQLSLTAANDHGRVILAPHRQHFTTHYLAKVSRESVKPCTSRKNETKYSEKDQSSNIDGVAYESNCSSRWDYVWLSQHHSIGQYPDCWQHPVQLLLQQAKHKKVTLVTDTNLSELGDNDGVTNKSEGNKFTDNKEQGKGDAYEGVVTVVPVTVPLNCHAQHLHKWKPTPGSGEEIEAAFVNSRVKVICCQGIIYRLMWHSKSVEAYPGDGSVIMSTGVMGMYFTHHSLTAGKVEEKMYSVHSLPPAVPGAAYSVARVVARAARFLEQICDETMNLCYRNEDVCWQTPPKAKVLPTPKSAVLLEECTVEGVGRFTAHSSGRVRVVFTDRLCLDMIADLNNRLKFAGLEQDQAPTANDIPNGMCKLLLPSGHYHFVSTSRPAGYERYVQSALEWVSWVNCTSSERADFYKDTPQDPNRKRSVEQELRKINNFNYIVDKTLFQQQCAPLVELKKQNILNSAVPPAVLRGANADIKLQPSHPQSASSLAEISVQEALKRTTAAIQDLDCFLNRKHIDS